MSNPHSSPVLDTRTATAADRDAIIRVWQAAGLTIPANDPQKDFDFALDGPASTILAGELSGRIVASVMVGHDGHRGAVYYVSVLPELQGQGFGAAILTAAEAWLRDRGIWKLNLMVRTTNAQAGGFYGALGYDETPRLVFQKKL